MINEVDRSEFDFDNKVKGKFSFLSDLGFSILEAMPTLVRYKKGDVEVDIYHGRQSYEVGAEVTIAGTRYSIEEIFRAADPENAESFFYKSATTTKVLESALDELSFLLKEYGGLILAGDLNFCSILDENRERWSEELERDVHTRQTRPKAEEAFRNKDYLKAAELYSSIREKLTETEAKKLDYAEKHK